MAQPFSFGFGGDDIDMEADEAPQTQPVAGADSGASAAEEPAMIEARSHSLEELLSTLPSKISYSTVEIESPSGKKLHVPRRELFDVRLQLMAEDGDADADGSSSSDALAGLDNSDIRTNIYEGGFKSWECSIDLAKLLLDRGPRKDIDDLSRVDHVIELGCGTAIPTLILFHHALLNALPLYFTLADYNASVLRLVTLPNLLLTFASTLAPTHPAFTPDTPSPFAAPGPSNGDLDLTPALLSAFTTTLATHQQSLTFLSGAWTPVPRFTSLVPSAPELRTLVLGSETIYSPAALTAFADVLVAVLGGVKEGKALVAAKRVYFGVGGGVDAFKEACAERGAVGYEVENAGVGGEGVARWVGEVQMM